MIGGALKGSGRVALNAGREYVRDDAGKFAETGGAPASGRPKDAIGNVMGIRTASVYKTRVRIGMAAQELAKTRGFRPTRTQLAHHLRGGISSNPRKPQMPSRKIELSPAMAAKYPRTSLALRRGIARGIRSDLRDDLR